MKPLLLIAFLLTSFCAFAEEIYNDIIFKGVTKQSTDYSCGAAAFSTLVNGLVENVHVSENDVMQIITSKSKKEGGYSLIDLMEASKNLGYYAEWQKVPVSELPKINIPVMLLIGLNSQFPHFVVLKGIKNNTAFLADSIRGNIRIPYDELVKESVNDKFKEWFVMAIEPSANKPKNTTLYLSDTESERQSSHATVEQSNAITLATMPKSSQLLVDYSFMATLDNNKRDGLKINSETLSHALSVRFGLTDDIQIGGSIRHSDNTTDIRFDNAKLSSNNANRQYGLFADHRLKLDDSGSSNIILGINGAYAEQDDVFGGGFNVTAYKNTDFAQILVGGSIGKEFTHNNEVNSTLPEFFYSGFVSANKRFGDNYLGSLTFSVSDAQNKNELSKSNPSYSISTAVSYALSKHFQVSPSFGYSFGNHNDAFSFGMNIAYIGGW